MESGSAVMTFCVMNSLISTLINYSIYMSMRLGQEGAFFYKDEYKAKIY